MLNYFSGECGQKDFCRFEPHRNISHGLFKEVKEHLREMIECGAIRESNSPFSSNVVIVRKTKMDQFVSLWSSES